MVAAIEKTALVIGASRGLGLGLTNRFLERGWRVIATERQGTKHLGLQDLAAETGERLEIERVDIDIEEELKGLRERLEGRRIDLLIVNAATIGDPEASFADRLLQVMKTNVVSVLSALHQLRDLVRDDGVVSVMSSELASVSDNTKGGWEPYRSSKSALNQSLRSFVAEQPDLPWSITAVAPGWVQTDLGGADAPLTVETSTNGVVDMLETRFAKRDLAFMNYKGDTLPW